MAKKKRYVYVPAFEDAKPGDKGTVVSASRARWKMKHDEPTPRILRMVRFVWMRQLLWADRYKLHKGTLGVCLGMGVLARAPAKDGDRLVVTATGEHLLEHDRRKPFTEHLPSFPQPEARA